MSGPCRLWLSVDVQRLISCVGLWIRTVQQSKWDNQGLQSWAAVVTQGLYCTLSVEAWVKAAPTGRGWGFYVCNLLQDPEVQTLLPLWSDDVTVLRMKNQISLGMLLFLVNLYCLRVIHRGIQSLFSIVPEMEMLNGKCSAFIYLLFNILVFSFSLEPVLF